MVKVKVTHYSPGRDLRAPRSWDSQDLVVRSKDRMPILPGDKHGNLSYVYWTVHHLTSWINWTNLMSLYESFVLLNIFRVLLHSSSGAGDCMWVCCSVSVCTGVLVRFGWCRVVSECRLVHVVLQPAFGYHPTPAEPHQYTNTHPNRAVHPHTVTSSWGWM
jgi:hypothetical protein